MIAKLGDFGRGIFCSFVAGTAASRTYALTAPIPAGSTVVVFGYMAGQVGSGPIVTSVSDSKGNPYTLRYVLDTTHIFLADSCRIPTALASGDLITVVRRSPDGAYAITGAWFSSCSFDKLAVDTWPSGTNAAKGGSATPVVSDELVLGAFGTYINTDAIAASILAAGAGYTPVGGSYQAQAGPDTTEGISCHWEYKIATGAPAAQVPTATMSAGPTAPSLGQGLTAVYSEFDPYNRMMAIA